MLCPENALLVSLIVLFQVFWTGCAPDPCAELSRSGNERGVGGPAAFSFSVIEQRGTAIRDSRTIECVQLSILNSVNYSDTLFSRIVRTDREKVRITELPAAELDVIIDRAGFFPVKLSHTHLSSGENVQPERFLLYSTDSGLAMPGEIGLTLKKGAALDTIRELYTGYDEITIRPTKEPDYYEIKIVFEDITMVRNDAERLIRRLIRSQYVLDARPLARFSSLID